MDMLVLFVYAMFKTIFILMFMRRTILVPNEHVWLYERDDFIWCIPD